MKTETKKREKKMDERVIHVIPYAHLDIAWVHSRTWHLDRYTRILDEVLDRLDRDPDYAFYLDTWTECIKHYIGLRPANVARLRRAIRAGRIAVCGGHYGNVRSTMVGDETFIRNLQLGMRHWRKLVPGLTTRVYANMDVTLGHSQMPQLLRQGGLEGYFADRPLCALDAQGVPRAFYWEGLSGDRLLVCRAHYGGLYIEAERHGKHWGEQWDAVAQGLRETYLAEPLKHGLNQIAMCVGSDDARPDKFIYGYDRDCNYSELIEEWNRRERGTMRLSTPDRLFEALGREKNLKVVRGVLDPADVCYNTAPHGRRGLWWLRELADRRLVEAERLCTLAAVLRGVKYPERELTEAWEKLLDTTPHAVQWVFRETWHEAELALREAIAAAEAQMNKAGAALAGERLPMDADGLSLINPVAAPRREVIPIWLMNGDLTRDLGRLVDGQGREVPFQVVAYPISNSECSLLAEVEVPACGQAAVKFEWTPIPEETPGLIGDNNLGDSYNDYWMKKHAGNGRKPADPNRFFLASDGIKAGFVDGRLVSVQDLKTGVTRKADGDSAFLEPVCFAMKANDWFIGEGIADNPEPFAVEEIRVEEQGPLRWRVTRTGRTGGYWVRQHLDLIKGLRGVRSTVQFLAPAESVSNLIGLSVPLSKKASLRADIPFGVEPRELKDFPYGRDERMIAGWMWARTWVAARDGQGAMALLSRDGDKFFRDHGTPRRLIHLLARRTIVFEKSWEHYIDTYDLGGRQVFEHDLLLEDADAGDTPFIQHAEAARHPIQCRYAMSGAIGKGESWLKIEPETAALSALYCEGGAVYLRLAQMADESARARVTLPFEPARASAVDFQDAPLKVQPTCKGRTVQVKLKPWQVCTLKLER